MWGFTHLPGASPELPHRRHRATLDFLSSRVMDPPKKLWFIKSTLTAYEAQAELIRRLPIVRGIVFHFLALESFGALARSSNESVIDFPKLPLRLLYYLRHALLAGTFAVVGFSGYHLYGASRTGADWLAARLIPTPEILSAAGLDFHPNRSTKAPANVWLVTETDTEELWSNGLRIDTEFTTTGKARHYLVFPKDGSSPIERTGPPVGIVYHASQNDMAPFAEDFSRDILDQTRDLIGWLKRREIYNYMIDRFGRVYRIVSEESVAIHAGESIWADEDYFYLNLNESFIGIAFESQWSTDVDLITAAQVQAATNLTDILRLRYGIEDINCVPHGLVSVNADQKLIGYHADWARGFPFNALGLKNKYETAPPSVDAFGFGYDDDLVDRLGGRLWPGVELAQAQLAERASKETIEPAELRARLRAHYEDLRDQLR